VRPDALARSRCGAGRHGGSKHASIERDGVAHEGHRRRRPNSLFSHLSGRSDPTSQIGASMLNGRWARWATTRCGRSGSSLGGRSLMTNSRRGFGMATRRSRSGPSTLGASRSRVGGTTPGRANDTIRAARSCPTVRARSTPAPSHRPRARHVSARASILERVGVGLVHAVAPPHSGCDRRTGRRSGARTWHSRVVAFGGSWASQGAFMGTFTILAAGGRPTT